MRKPLVLRKADVRRALVNYHFTPNTLRGTFEKLKSVQYDPLAPIGCNHDLVLQARVPGYKVGDWQKLAYEERFIYDGWDKQACLVLMDSWPVRRIFHQ
ncbi:MAG: crosslink repair DNA glycosylase YcaQ family protein, partial [bacterium]